MIFMCARKAAGFGFIALIFTSCVTMSDYNFRHIDRSIADGDYPAAYGALTADKKTIYAAADESLKLLDSGLISHYCGEYGRSNAELSQAELLLERNAAKSVSQAVGSLLVNDTVIDYSGDPYEAIYTNVFMALNYLKLGKFDDALVEIRRFDIKLKEMTVKYQAQIEQQKRQLADNAQSVPEAKLTFHNSALARYVSMLIYRADGDESNAAVDRRQIEQAFALQPTLYDFPCPQSIREELAVPKGMARVNLLAFAGRAPEKEEVSAPLWAVDGFYAIALPAMQARASDIRSIEWRVTASDGRTMQAAQAEKIESIENIALETYTQKYSLIVAKTIARMAAKLTATVALDVAASYVDNDAASFVFSLLGAASKVSIFATERADVRTSRYFPAAAFVSGLTLEPGVYSVSVFFKNGNRTVASRTYPNIEIQANRLNLVESYCLR